MLNRSSTVQPDAAFFICIVVMVTTIVEILAMSMGVFVPLESSSALVISVYLQQQCAMAVGTAHLGLMKLSAPLKVIHP